MNKYMSVASLADSHCRLLSGRELIHYQDSGMSGLWIVHAFLLSYVVASNAFNREYFIAIEETVWDYAPYSRRPELPDHLVIGVDRIGKKYKKAVYREYTDDTFRTKATRSSSLGLFGPIVKGEVKDTIVIHALNRASRKYSFHPHGVFYLKSSEGALYKDGTTGFDKADDGIPPGGRHTYKWEIRDEYAPGPEDPSCLAWAYHSHVDATKDLNSGLIGTLLTCKKGILLPDGRRRDANREFAIVSMIIDENESWYLDENIQTYTFRPRTVDKTNASFIESNKIPSINGRVLSNLRGLDMCEGHFVSWYMLAFGNLVHTMQFQGNTVKIDRHRLDTVTLFPATFRSASMWADNPGIWELECQFISHEKAGMKVTYEVSDICGRQTKDGLRSLTGKFRTYYVAIEEVEWDYGPTGINGFSQQPLNETRGSDRYFQRGPNRIGGKYKKAIYREYTDFTFSRKSKRDPTLGILGPVISGEVGDTIRVVLRNKASKRYSIEPHGVLSKNSRSADPGETVEQLWYIPENMSPTPGDDECLTYLYTSKVDIEKDQHAGLIGPMLVCKPGALQKVSRRRTYYVLLNIFNENLSPYIEENIEKYISNPDSVDRNDEQFKESNFMRTFNGFMFLNLEGIEVCVNEETDFRVLSNGEDRNIHSFNMGGVIIRQRKEYTGVVGVFPHTTATVTISPFSPGTSLMGCWVNNHGALGMVITYKAMLCGTSMVQWMPDDVKTYYIGIVEEIWEYLPKRTDRKGNPVDDPNHKAYKTIRQQDGKFIGTKYKKAIFYEYTDKTFTQKKPKPAHLGFLGPLIQGEIGDQINVVLRNMATRPFSAQPFGVYVQGIMNVTLFATPPGEERTYIWELRPELTPAPGDPDCFASRYQSVVSFIADLYSGLNGPILICRKGTLSLGRGGGVDQDFHLLFNIFDENESYYLDDNIRMFAKADPENFNKLDPDFVASNKMNQLNGIMYHLPELDMRRGDWVRWNVFALGEEDIHSIHFHANAITHQNDKENRRDVFEIIPGLVATMLMLPDAVGEWLLHCHVNEHVDEGMVTTYNVAEGRAVCRSRCDGYKICDVLDCSLLGIEKSSDFINARGMIMKRKHRETVTVDSFDTTRLDLSHNQDLGDGMALKEILSHFPKLTTLKLKNINLSLLRNDLFDHNPQLRYLYLSHNSIRQVAGELVNYRTSLELLDLSYNKLTSLPPGVSIGGYAGLQSLDLRGNGNLSPKCLIALHTSRYDIASCLARARFQHSGFRTRYGPRKYD